LLFLSAALYCTYCSFVRLQIRRKDIIDKCRACDRARSTLFLGIFVTFWLKSVKNVWRSLSNNNHWTVRNVINCRNNFVRKILSMKMIFTSEQKIFMIELYFCNCHTLHIFRESGSVQRKCSIQSSYWRKYWDCRTSNGRRTPIISQATVAADWVISVNLSKNCSKG
jgi:hypothetical protein